MGLFLRTSLHTQCVGKLFSCVTAQFLSRELEAAVTSTTAGSDSSWLHASHSHFEVASLKLVVCVPEFAKHCIQMYLGICTHH